MRVAIRNPRSARDVKPRVFDVLIRDDGDIDIEVKNGRSSEVIALAEVLEQITKAKEMATEP